MIRRPPRSPLFPTPTLSRSLTTPPVGATKRSPAEPVAEGVKGHWVSEKTRMAVTRLADRKSTRLNSSHANISYAVFCLKKKKVPHNVTLELYSSDLQYCQSV